MTHATVQIVMVLLVIHAGMHFQSEFRSTWRRLKRLLGIEEMSTAPWRQKLLAMLIMLVLTAIATSPVIYYSVEFGIAYSRTATGHPEA